MEEYTTDESFTVHLGASVTAISPTQAWAGDEVTITGNNFFNVPASDVIVDFGGGATANATSINGNVIKVKVPEGAKNGTFNVTFTNKQTVKGTRWQRYALYENDFNKPDGGSILPYRDGGVPAPNYVKIVDQALEFYYNAEAYAQHEGDRKYKGAEIVSDFTSWSEGWYGFKFYLPEGKFPKNVEGSTIAQIFQSGDGNTWAGLLKVDYENLVIYHRHYSGNPHIDVVGSVKWNEWNNVVLYFRAGRNNKGCIKIWLGNDLIESHPTLNEDNINFFLGYWLDDNTLLGEVTADNIKADIIGPKFGLYVSDEHDRTIRFDDLRVLEGNPDGAFDMIKPIN